MNMARKSTACFSVEDCDGIAIALELCAGTHGFHLYRSRPFSDCGTASFCLIGALMMLKESFFSEIIIAGLLKAVYALRST